MIGFSVIIPTLNRTTFLITTLKDLVCQEINIPFEIVVIDQSQKIDETVIAFSSKHKMVKYKHVTHFKGLPEARNYGASLASYDYLLYLDDDIECNKDLLAEHYRFLKQDHINMVAGGITEKYNENKECAIGKFVKRSATPLRGYHKKAEKEVDHAGGGNFSIKKNAFKAVAGVDENLTKGAALYEETDLCLRLKKAGYKIFYNYKAHMYHLAAATGGCREPNIHKYIYSLSRNRSIIIKRHLPWYYQLTAHLFLVKLIFAYIKGYKDFSIYKSYQKGKKEGNSIALQSVVNTSI